MPDLGKDAIKTWLAGKPGLTLPDVRGERPGLEDAAVVAALQRLGAVLDQMAEQPDRLAPLGTEPAIGGMRVLMGQLAPGQLTRLLDWLKQRVPFSGGPFIVSLTKPGEDDAGAFINAFVSDTERRALLARIFAPDVVAALKGASALPIATGRAA